MWALVQLGHGATLWVLPCWPPVAHTSGGGCLHHTLLIRLEAHPNALRGAPFILELAPSGHEQAVVLLKALSLRLTSADLATQVTPPPAEGCKGWTWKL